MELMGFNAIRKYAHANITHTRTPKHTHIHTSSHVRTAGAVMMWIGGFGGAALTWSFRELCWSVQSGGVETRRRRPRGWWTGNYGLVWPAGRSADWARILLTETWAFRILNMKLYMFRMRHYWRRPRHRLCVRECAHHITCIYARYASATARACAL